MPKMCQKFRTRLAARLRPDPLGSLSVPPDSLATMRGPTSKGKRRGRKGEDWKGEEEWEGSGERGRKGSNGEGERGEEGGVGDERKGRGGEGKGREGWKGRACLGWKKILVTALCVLIRRSWGVRRVIRYSARCS